MSQIYKNAITFKHCGICGKLVEGQDDSTSVLLTYTIDNFRVWQMYHMKCFKHESRQTKGGN